MPLLRGVRAEPLRPLEADWTMPPRGRVTASFQPAEPATGVSNARFDTAPSPDFVRDHGRVNRPNGPTVSRDAFFHSKMLQGAATFQLNLALSSNS
jgi:hypothetical protein